MSEMKNDPSELYDEEFLKKKEEFYSNIENLGASSRYEISEDDSDFEQLVDDFDDGDLMSKLGSKKDKKAKKNKRGKKKKSEVIDTPEPEYDIFDLVDQFGIKEDKGVKKPKAKKEKKKKPEKTEPVKAPPKPVKPLKPFVPHTPVEEVKADVYVKDEELYEQQNVDIDELLKNLGIPTAEEIARQQQEEEEALQAQKEAEEAEKAEKAEEAEITQEADGEEDDVKVFTPEEKEEMIDISSVSDEKPLFDSEGEDKPENKAESDNDADSDPSSTRYFTLDEKKEEENAMGATRHFNLKAYIQSAGQSMQDSKKNKASFTQHFRFLKNKESDETILESAPTGKGKDSMMDSVKADEGEDIFTAVEKAQKKNKRKGLNTKQSFISLNEYDEKLTARLSKSKINLYLLLGALVISLVLTVPFSAYGLSGAVHGLIYGLINILVVLLICVIARKELILGFNNIRYLSPDRNSVTLILGIFVLLFNIITMAFGTLGVNGVKPYTLCFAFAVLVRVTGEYLDDLTAHKGVKALSQKGDYEGIHYVSSKNDALAIAHGLSEKNVPTILYGAESRVDEGIREDKAPKKDEDKFYGFTSAAVLLVGFVAGIILLVRNKDAVSFVTALVSSVCFCLPVMNEFVSSVFFFETNSRLSKKGAAVNDTESIEILSTAKAVSADAKELFTCEVSSFKRVKGALVSKSDAAVFAAATLKAGGSMAGDCFTEFIESLGIDLPEAEDLQYEEKLGFACWVAERRVLVGNRQMLVEHSIDAPTEAEEKAYAGKKNVMYVALEGQIVASFLVRYKVVPSFRKIAADFDKTGLVLMINSYEPCLDEVNCAARLSLDVAAVKVLSQKAAALINSYKEDSEKGKATSLICRKGENSLLSLVVGAHNLYQGDRLIGNLLLSGQAVALVLILLSVILNMPLFFNPVIITVLQILWSFMSFCIASGEFRNRVKRKIGALTEKGRKSK